MNKVVNPYDDVHSKVEQPLSILINTDSLELDIRKHSKNIQKLCAIDKLDEIWIVFSPTENKELELLIKKEYECEIGKYDFKDNLIGINYSHYQSGIMYTWKDSFENKLKKVNNSKLNSIDLCIMEDKDSKFDFFVMSNDDLDKVNNHSKAVDIDDIIEKIRLFMLNKYCFYVRKQYKIDETFYYLYRYKKTFSEYQRIWGNVCNIRGISEWADSLAQRFEFYCRASDKTKIECLKTPNNTTASHIKYNFSYLILIMTGIYDNLAWIMNIIYDLEIDKNKVGIKIPTKFLNNNKLTDYLKCLKDKNNELVEYISSPLTQKYIHLLYPIRDALVHRDFFNSVHFVNENEKIEKNLVRVPLEVYNICGELDIFKKGNSKFIFKLGDEVFVEPYKFITIIGNIFENLVNDILSKLELKTLLSKYQRSEEEYDTENMSEFLGLKCEPLYF